MLLRITVVAIIALLLLSSRVTAEVPVPQQAAILVRAMSFDRSLKARAGRRVDLLVVTSTRAQEGQVAASAFAALAGLTVQGVPLQVETASVETAAELTALVERKQPDAVYLAPGLDGLVAALKALAQARGFLTVASTMVQAQGGLSLAVDATGDRAVLVINLTQARAERVDFSSDLLKLARVSR